MSPIEPRTWAAPRSAEAAVASNFRLPRWAFAAWTLERRRLRQDASVAEVRQPAA